MPEDEHQMHHPPHLADLRPSRAIFLERGGRVDQRAMSGAPVMGGSGAPSDRRGPSPAIAAIAALGVIGPSQLRRVVNIAFHAFLHHCPDANANFSI